MVKYKVDLMAENFYEKHVDDKLQEYAFIKNNTLYYVVDDVLKEKLSANKLTEFLFDIYRKINKHANGIDMSSFKTKSVPYLQAHIMGKKLPYIIYLGSRIGLLEALNSLGIEHNISKSRDKSSNCVNIMLYNEEGARSYLNCFYHNFRQESIVNGLLYVRNKRLVGTDFNDQHIFDDYITTTQGGRVLSLFDLVEKKLIDTYTKEILKLQHHSDNIIDLYKKDMIDMLFGQVQASDVDLKHQRVRLNEQFFGLTYKQLNQALSDLKKRKNDDKAKLYFSPDYAIQELIKSGSLRLGNLTNPVDEIKMTTQITMRGPMSPEKRAQKMPVRDLDSSFDGAIACETAEYCIREVFLNIYNDDHYIIHTEENSFQHRFNDKINLVKDGEELSTTILGIGFDDLKNNYKYIFGKTKHKIVNIELPKSTRIKIDDLVEKYNVKVNDYIYTDQNLYIESVSGSDKCIVQIEGFYKGKTKELYCLELDDEILQLSGTTPIWVHNIEENCDQWIMPNMLVDNLSNYQIIKYI